MIHLLHTSTDYTSHITTLLHVIQHSINIRYHLMTPLFTHHHDNNTHVFPIHHYRSIRSVPYSNMEHSSVLGDMTCTNQRVSSADIRDAVMRVINACGLRLCAYKESENCVIKRGSSSYLRKCTVVWHDTLPESISLDIKKNVSCVMVCFAHIYTCTATCLPTKKKAVETRPGWDQHTGSLPLLVDKNSVVR